MKSNTVASSAPAEPLVEYLIESGAVCIPPPKGQRGPLRILLPGSTIKLPPRAAARLLLNKARPLSVVNAALRAAEVAAQAEAEALLATGPVRE